MESIEIAIATDDQPIGGRRGSATLMGESKWLSRWMDPLSLEVQELYRKLTKGMSAEEEKVRSCLKYVSDYPYTRFVKVVSKVEGKTFVQEDAWLEPGAAIYSPALNCANRAFLLASLLRQEIPLERIWVVLGNLNFDGQDGHAWVLLRQSGDYILESTTPVVSQRFVPVSVADRYEAVIFFNDKEVKMVPGLAVREPFSACYCVPWLEDYLDKRACWNMR